MKHTKTFQNWRNPFKSLGFSSWSNVGTCSPGRLWEMFDCFLDVCGKKQLRHRCYSLDLCRKFFIVWWIWVELFVVTGVHMWIFSHVCTCAQSWMQNRSEHMCFICNKLNVPNDFWYSSLTGPLTVPWSALTVCSGVPCWEAAAVVCLLFTSYILSLFVRI